MTFDEIVAVTEDIDDKERFAGFVALLAHDLRTNPGDWENVDLGRFLDALGNFARVIDRFYKNNNLVVEIAPVQWRVFADMLLAARIRE